MSIIKIGSKVERIKGSGRWKGMECGDVDYVVEVDYKKTGRTVGRPIVGVTLLKFGGGHSVESLKVIETDNEPKVIANHHYYLLWKEGVDVQFMCAEGRWVDVLLEDFSFNIDNKFRIKPDNSNKIQKLRQQLESVTNELKLLESEQ